MADAHELSSWNTHRPIALQVLFLVPPVGSTTLVLAPRSADTMVVILFDTYFEDPPEASNRPESLLFRRHLWHLPGVACGMTRPN